VTQAKDGGLKIAESTGLEFFHACKLGVFFFVIALADVDLTKPLHITAVGSDAPGKREFQADLLERVQLRMCDSRAQAVVRSEYQYLSEGERGSGFCSERVPVFVGR